ncbi:hypothetical protein [Psychrobacillus sp.]|uniref:hypothetical protein n=1 Tax=Psychrobacillus sp. TaxID=1871623 RepID=UPI0028BE173C|nr:hypothetical protein [Psychrobacillus sp.]
MQDKVIEQYQEDENIMIHLFTQWCANHDLNAQILYEEAYPSQLKNTMLLKAMEDTEKDLIEVDTGTVLEVLQLFGNEDLAFVVSKAAERIV